MANPRKLEIAKELRKIQSVFYKVDKLSVLLNKIDKNAPSLDRLHDLLEEADQEIDIIIEGLI